MPNWNENKLKIVTRVNPEEFMLKNKAWNYILLFEKLVPIWKREYDSAVKAWWCKWDAFYISSEEEFLKEEWYYWFDVIKEWDLYFIEWRYYTPWTPPLVYLEKLYDYLVERDEDSNLDNYFYEPGCWVLWCYSNWNETYLSDMYNYKWLENLELYLVDDNDVLDVLVNFESEVLNAVDVLQNPRNYTNYSPTDKKSLIKASYKLVRG